MVAMIVAGYGKSSSSESPDLTGTRLEQIGAAYNLRDFRSLSVTTTAGTALLAKLGNRQPPCCCSPAARSAQPKKNSRRQTIMPTFDLDNEAGSGLWKFKEFSNSP